MGPKRRIGIVDLVAQRPTRQLYARLMFSNLASIMPQAIGAWCEEMGHDVKLICYTGREDLLKELPDDIDILFIGSFTRSAQLAYAISNMFRQRGVVTVLGGPHARCYPQDAARHFDYVFGFTNKEMIRDVVSSCERQEGEGQQLCAPKQPAELPGVKERWKFIEQTLQGAPWIKITPMIGSLGCPYTCGFCIDAEVPYQPLSFELLKEDLRFLQTKFDRPVVGWHDPNFGVKFNDYMGAIEEVVKPDSMDFIAETSLAFLTEPNLKRLKKNGFKAILPGIESWYEVGNKSKAARAYGMERVKKLADHVNMVLRYIPYIQTNFVIGLDSDEGPEPFELTKKFVDLAPGAFPGYSLLSAFGQAAPVNLDYQRNGRVLGFPFHFLDNHSSMNVRPKNYEWIEFYDRVIDLTEHSFSTRAIYRRFKALDHKICKWMNVVRAISSEGFGRIRYYKKVRQTLQSNRPFRGYFEGDHQEIPEFYVERVKNDLGNTMWSLLPDKSLTHDKHAYLNSVAA